MTRSGYAKGMNSGHATTERELKPKAARRKGVSEKHSYHHRRHRRIVSRFFVFACFQPSSSLNLHLFPFIFIPFLFFKKN